MPRTLAAIFALAAMLTVPATARQTPTPSGKVVVVKAAYLIDGVNSAPISNAVVIVTGDRITAVGSGLAVPMGAAVVDLGQATLLPGFIDCHTHVTGQPGENFYDDAFRRSSIDDAVVAHVYARRTLEAGFTTIRDVGAGEYLDVALRNAINRSDIPGPRMQVAGLAISATGGHGDLNGFSPYLRFDRMSGIADGIDAIRKLVRTNIKYGADLIKVLATAGVLSEEDSIGGPQYSQEELNALVAEAHMWDRRVAAHAHGAEGIKRAIRAGVSSVEHASFIDDEGLALAKEHGTYLVMDIYNDDYILAEYGRKGYPEKIMNKERQVGRVQRENFRKAVAAGRQDGLRHGCRCVPARTECPTIRDDGRMGHDTVASHPCGDQQCRRPAGMVGSCGQRAARPVCRSRRRGRQSARGHHDARARRLRHEGRRCLQTRWPFADYRESDRDSLNRRPSG